MIEDVDPRILAPLTPEQIRKWCWDGGDWRRLMQQASARGSVAWRIAYGWYLQSRAWKKKSDERRDIDGHKCTNCHNTQHLQAHHLSYKNVGDEDVQNDLITLCERCHKVRHAMPHPTAALLLERLQDSGGSIEEDRSGVSCRTRTQVGTRDLAPQSTSWPQGWPNTQ